MSNIRIFSNRKYLRSGEELFNLKNEIVGHTSSKDMILKSCDVKDGVAFIEKFERFYNKDDDSEIVVLIKDHDDHILWKWSFDHIVGSGAAIEAETLIHYLEEKFGCPVKQSYWID